MDLRIADADADAEEEEDEDDCENSFTTQLRMLCKNFPTFPL